MLKVEVIGNLGADAETKESNGSKFVTFRIADTQKYKTQDGNEKEVTNWIDCTMNNAESKVIPYLKAGVKVFVRGNGDLRVYSSKKDRCMKAGLRVNVLEVELCGGNNDEVARQVIDPNDGTIHETKKFYWCDIDTKSLKKDEVKEIIDARGKLYIMNKQGFVAPAPTQSDESTEETQAESNQQ